MAEIDILLPYWGDPALCLKTIESVLAQTEPDWRLLIFDDCYPSDTIKTYCTGLRDKRVIYSRNTKNLGITKNFNLALKNATAKYCVMIGCDDIMLPSYVETAIKNIGEADFYQPNVDVIDADGRVYLPLTDRVKRVLRPKKAGVYSGEKLAASLSRGNWLYFPSIMWRTVTIKKYGFDPRYKIVEDFITEINMIMDGCKLQLDNSITFQYRRFAKSLSSLEKSKGGVRFNEEDFVYNEFAKRFTSIGWREASRAAKLRITHRLHKLVG